jgi:hypothetical protein
MGRKFGKANTVPVLTTEQDALLRTRNEELTAINQGLELQRQHCLLLRLLRDSSNF